MVDINVDPNLFSFDFVSAFIVSWHGFFSFVAVASAVLLVGRWANLVVLTGNETSESENKLDSDVIYSVAIWAIAGGIVGARLVHVLDNWDLYKDNLIQILYVANGGIALWGGILGGFLAGAGYCLIFKYPVGVIADLAAPAVLYAQTIGRLGDIVNGEHCARAADFFGFRWIHELSNARVCANGVENGSQPVILFEMVWNMIALVVIWKFRGRIKPDGMLFALYLVLYSVGRFLITFFREDRVWAFGMQEAHYIALLVLVITVPLLVAKGRFSRAFSTVTAPAHSGTRAQRRRQNR